MPKVVLKFLTPKTVRELVDSKNWSECRRIEKWIRREEKRTRALSQKSRERTLARRRLALLALELVRKPRLYLREENPQAVSTGQFYLWGFLSRYLRSREAGVVAKQWVASKDVQLRNTGVLALCSLALESQLSICMRLINSKDQYDSHRALLGILVAVADGYAPSKWRRSILEYLNKVMTGRAKLPGGQIPLFAVPSVLIAADSNAAIELLCSKRVLHIKNPAIRSAILELRSATYENPEIFSHLSRSIDIDLLWSIFELWKSGKRIAPVEVGPFPSGLHDSIASEFLHVASCFDYPRSEAQFAAFRTRTLLPAEWVELIAKNLRKAKRVYRSRVSV